MNLGSTEMMIVLAVVVLLFGGKKIPELMRGVGKGIGELKRGLEEGKRGIDESLRVDTND
jgi:sec-independent protein translocase protein TatA